MALGPPIPVPRGGISSMEHIPDLLEYGELSLYRCDHWHYAELVLEIPADNTRMIVSKEETLEEALTTLREELGKLATG